LVEQSAYHVDRIAISKSPNPSTNVVSSNPTILFFIWIIQGLSWSWSYSS